MSLIKINSGQKINKWTLLRQEYHELKSGKKVLKWMCMCNCGTKALVMRSDLLSGKSTQCRSCCGTMPKDLSRKVFGSWNVVSCDIKKHNRRYCKCECSCGNIAEVAAQTLSNGASTRCIKCYNRFREASNHSGQKLYSIWSTMIARCHNKKHQQYFNYGGRGIFVCERWHELNNFIEDMYPRTSLNHSIDRIDNNNGYYKENCRWATWEQQANNRRGLRFINYKGEIKTLSKWAIKLNTSADTLHHYLARNSFEKAFIHFKGMGYRREDRI